MIKKCKCGHGIEDHLIGHRKGQFCLKEIKIESEGTMWMLCPCNGFVEEEIDITGNKTPV